MNLTPEKELEKLLEEISLLKKNRLIIVEGPNDRKALEVFGIQRIVTLGKPRYKIVEMCKKEVVVLTDLDAEGERIYRSVKFEKTP